MVCDLCHHRCHIAPGCTGVCRVRKNEEGKLVSLVYGECVSLTPDPIEKKPFYHFLPGTLAMSIATAGCNFCCDFCQNCDISQAFRDGNVHIPTTYVEPEKVIRAAKTADCASMAFTYTEPTVFFEYAWDIARLARDAGLANTFVSNGYMTPEAVECIAPYLDAINVDLKCFKEETYRKVMGGGLAGVLETIQALHRAGIWLEITTLLIPGMNDSAEEIRDTAEFIAGVSPDIPWHVSRFFPRYHRLEPEPTPMDTIRSALKAGEEAGLRHLYCGNMPDKRYENTLCHACGATVVAREGYRIRRDDGAIGRCPQCGESCAGVWRLGSP